MRVFSIALFKQHEEASSLLLLTTELTFMNYFTRSTAKEFITFQSRLLANKTPRGVRQYVQVQDFQDTKLRACAYTDSQGLCCVVLLDEEYPQRTGHGLVAEAMKEFLVAFGGKWESVLQDQKFALPKIDEMLQNFQDPAKVDKIYKIRQDLDEVRGVAMKTLDDLMSRGEKLEDLVAKSNDLNMVSKKFYDDARRNNQCCKLY